MQIPSFSFVQFGGAEDVLPFRDTGDLSFQVISDNDINRIALVDMSGLALLSVGQGIRKTGNVYDITLLFDNYPPCFRVALFNDDTELAVSSTVFTVVNSRYISNINYLCEDDSFDFVYCDTKFINRVCLPIYLKEAQFPQKQTVYEKRNGQRKLLSASISKEWEIETDYLSEGVHEKLIIALSHDKVYINGKLVTKTGDYSIDYGNILKRNGVEYMKGSCKVSANVTHRNSNCGNTCDTEGAVFEVYPRQIIFN